MEDKYFTPEDLPEIFKIFCRVYDIKPTESDEQFLAAQGWEDFRKPNGLDYTNATGAKFFGKMSGESLEFRGHAAPEDPENKRKDDIFQWQIRDYIDWKNRPAMRVNLDFDNLIYMLFLAKELDTFGKLSEGPLKAPVLRLQEYHGPGIGTLATLEYDKGVPSGCTVQLLPAKSPRWEEIKELKVRIGKEEFEALQFGMSILTGDKPYTVQIHRVHLYS